MNKNWHTLSTLDVIKLLGSEEYGLTKEEAKKRLQEYGPNKLAEGKKDSLAVIFLRQFQSPLIYILFAAGMIVFAMGNITDGFVIFAVLIFNAIAGTLQEGKARNTLLALKNFSETNATVLRDNREIVVPDKEVVPGDIIAIQEGEKAPADARIIFSNYFKVDEAALTGESASIHKTPDILADEDLPVADQKNMIFKGTHIVAGNAKAIVVATGPLTVIGKISREIAGIKTEIPLKANIRYLSRIIIAAVAVISFTLFFLGLAMGKPAKEMFATVVSLSVSIIPEGLLVVMTLVLATGVWRMSRRNALVKKLQAVEALGQARVIAMDKTGTITKNEMVVKKVYLPAGKAGTNGNFFEVGGDGYEPRGEITLGDRAVDPLNHPEMILAGRVASFCANAHTFFLEEEKRWHIAGDPTEAAIGVFAEKIGFHKDELERESPRIADIPFDYKNKYHATLHEEVGGGGFLTVVGAPEVILDLSKLSEEEKMKLESVFHKMSEDGLRVLAFAAKKGKKENISPEDVNNLTFAGFFGIKDSLRPEAIESIGKAKSAGIKVVMITGDHKITAMSIAKEAGILGEKKEEEIIITGKEIDGLSDSELRKIVGKVLVFARVTPEHKLRIIRAYRENGEIVAMTGDGVNDAPSLVAADLGIAMGKIGTEVAKEASDIVILDDNLNSIVSAIEEGRSIYKTIKKVILYLFSTSIGEVFTIAGALLLGFPLPLLPAQIIWLNFVTDGFLDVALAMEPKEKGLLQKKFERPKKYLVDLLMTKRMFLMAIPMAVGTLFVFEKYFGTDIVKAWTISLTILAVFQWFNAWNCRSEERSIFRMNPFSNKFLIGATIVVILLQLLVIYNPLMQKIMRTSPLALSDWLIIVPIAFSIIFFEEIRKFFYRRKLIPLR
ncbi:MAG: HAD-IC family P-type ATPase [Candidatus Paceibacterota bacterium]